MGKLFPEPNIIKYSNIKFYKSIITYFLFLLLFIFYIKPLNEPDIFYSKKVLY